MQTQPSIRCIATAQPAAEPLTVAEAKSHLRVEHSDDDALIGTLISAAREFVENLSGRTIAQRAFIQTMDSFPCGRGDIVLRRSPVTAVASVSYYDSSGIDTVMVVNTDYRLDLAIIPARIRLPILTASWVSGYQTDDCVRITYTAGAAIVPAAAKQTILLLVGHWYENRESVVVGQTSNAVHQTVSALIDSYRIGDIAL